MEKAQAKQVIIELTKELDKKLKMNRRGLLSDLEAYRELNGMLEGIKFTLKILYPNNVFVELGILNGIIDDIFLGTKQQKRQAISYLELIISNM